MNVFSFTAQTESDLRKWIDGLKCCLRFYDNRGGLNMSHQFTSYYETLSKMRLRFRKVLFVESHDENIEPFHGDLDLSSIDSPPQDW